MGCGGGTGDVCMHLADSLHGMAETNTAPCSNYTPISNNQNKKIIHPCDVKSQVDHSLLFLQEKKLRKMYLSKLTAN